MAPRDADRLVDAGRAYFDLMGIVSGGGGMFRNDGKDETMEAANRAIAHFESALAISPQQNAALIQMASVYLVEGDVISPVDPLPAIEIIKKGLVAFNRLPPSVRALPTVLKQEGELHMGLAWAQQQAGEYREALETIEPAHRIMEKLAEADRQNATLVRRVAGVYDIEADCHRALHNLEAAIDDYRHVLAAWDQQIALDSSKPSNFMIRASAQGDMAKVLAMAGRMAEAATYAKASIDYLTGAADRPNASPAYLDEAATVLVGTPLVSLRDYPRGLAYAQRADQLSGGKDFTAFICLAQAYANLGKATEAMEAVKRGLILVPAPAPGASPSEPRKTLEKQQQGIETLMRTGRLPRDFNDTSR
jgi:tetratricopeptide (TPR) repeat protein